MQRLWKLLLIAFVAVGATLLIPRTDSAALTLAMRPLAGDSVQYRVGWTLPGAALDSLVVRWSLTGNTNQRHTFIGTIPVQDSARFAAPASIPGGALFSGDVIIEAWANSQNSAVSRTYTLTIPDVGPPPPVSNVVFLDSAVVY